MKLYDLIFTSLCTMEERGLEGYAMMFGGMDANYKLFKYCLYFDDNYVTNLHKYKNLEIKRIQAYETENLGYMFKYTTEDGRGIIHFNTVEYGEDKKKESKGRLLEVKRDMKNREFCMNDRNGKELIMTTKGILDIMSKNSPCSDLEAESYKVRTLNKDFIRYLTDPKLIIEAAKMEKISKTEASGRLKVLLNNDAISRKNYRQAIEIIN